MRVVSFTGLGKSFAAREEAKKLTGGYYRITESNMSSDRKTCWFNGYQGEQTLIIDDLNTGWVPYNVLLNWCEGYPQELQTKGGTAWAGWTTVFITSNVDPNDWYGVGSVLGFPDANRHALERRIAGGGVRGGYIHFDSNADIPNGPVYTPRRFTFSDIQSGRVSPPRDARGDDPSEPIEVHD